MVFRHALSFVGEILLDLVCFLLGLSRIKLVPNGKYPEGKCTAAQEIINSTVGFLIFLLGMMLLTGFWQYGTLGEGTSVPVSPTIYCLLNRRIGWLSCIDLGHASHAYHPNNFFECFAGHFIRNLTGARIPVPAAAIREAKLSDIDG